MNKTVLLITSLGSLRYIIMKLYRAESLKIELERLRTEKQKILEKYQDLKCLSCNKEDYQQYLVITSLIAKISSELTYELKTLSKEKVSNSN